MRSRKLLPGSWVISTTIRSESTRVPPVTALRSPPASRITGADSPVIADSSTDAMPSITVPSPGITSPAVDDHDVAAAELGGRPLAAVAQMRDRLGAHRAQRVGLGLAAALGQRLGEVGEDDREPQPERDGEREPGGLVAAAERRAAEDLDQPADRRDQGADLDHEHHRVAELDPRVELAQDASQRRRAGSRGRRASATSRLRSSGGLLWSRARFSSSTFTPGSPRKPSERPSVLSSISSLTRSSGDAARLGDAVGLDAGVGLGDVGIDAGGRVGDRVDRHVAAVEAGRVGPLEREVGVEVARANRCEELACWLGPWLMKKVASAA